MSGDPYENFRTCESRLPEAPAKPAYKENEVGRQLQERLGRRRLYAQVSNKDLVRALAHVMTGLPLDVEVRGVFAARELMKDELLIHLVSDSFPLVTRETKWDDMQILLTVTENGKALRPVNPLPQRTEGDEGACI
jgi:hypothetical protein